MKGLVSLALMLSLMAFLAVEALASPLEYVQPGMTYSARKAPTVNVGPLKYITVSVQPTESTDFGRAQVKTAVSTGFNSIRVIMDWSYPKQNEVVNDFTRLCNVAAPAAEHGLKLFLNVIPTKRKPPVTSSQITWYNKTVSDYLHHLAGENGCAKGLSELLVQVANEPNYELFWPQTAAAEEYTRLLVRTYKFIRQQVDKHEFSVPVLVVGGELAASRDPIRFMERMSVEARKMRYRGPFFDLFSYHCYGTAGNAVTPPDAVYTSLSANFGSKVPLLCTEYADDSPTQGAKYCQAMGMAVNKGLAGFGWFRLFDDPVPEYTGIYYYDPALGQQDHQPAAKPSLNKVRQANSGAASGAVTCG